MPKVKTSPPISTTKPRQTRKSEPKASAPGLRRARSKTRIDPPLLNTLSAFLEWTHDSFFALDREWRFLYANRRYGDLVQRDHNSLVGKVFWEEFPKYLGTEVEEHYRRAMDTRKPVQFEAAGRYSDTWYEIAIHPTQEGLMVFAFDRTEEKRALEMLRQSEENLQQRNAQIETERRRWQGIVEGIADEVWVCDLQGNISLLNLGAVTPMGLKEFSDKKIEEVLQEVDILEVNGLVRPVERSPLLVSLKGEIVRGDEIMRHRKSGKVRFRRYSSGPMHDEEGHIIGSVAIVHDVTEIKQAEIDLQSAHQQTVDILESIGDAFYHVDEDWVLTYINKQAEKLWDKPREHILGKKMWDVFPQMVGSETYHAHLLAQQENHPLYLETISSIINCWITMSIYPSDDGLSVYFRDIDSQKKAQQALERSQAVLAQAGEMAHVGAWDIEFIKPEIDNSNPLRWSDETYRIFGYKAGSVEVTNDLFFRHVHPYDRSLVASALQNAVAAHSSYSVEHRILRVDGTERLVSEHAQISFDDLGRPRWIIGAVQDVTDQRKVQNELRRYAEQLERSNKELQDFAYVASHDLQEPLRKVSFFGTSLFDKLQARLSADEKDLFDRLLKANGRMQSMINDLLELSRINTQGKPFRKVDLRKVAEIVLADLEVTLTKTDGKVEIGSLPKVAADPVQMERLLLNLIGNGLKYHREDVPPVIRLTGKRIKKAGRDLVEVQVEDNGIGFEMQYAEHIFQPFHRLHGRSKYEGTGMGLAICRQIVLRHGGTITAQSILGEGSAFVFTLPAA